MYIFDFDGTLVDLWPRYYMVFRDLLSADTVSLEKYKKAKRLYQNDSELAQHFGITLPSDYFDGKKELLEDSYYLSFDVPFFEADVINDWLSREDTFILSKRRKHENLLSQLEKLGIKAEVKTVRDKTKKEWIIENTNRDDNIVIIGDSLEELSASTLPNVEAWITGYGLVSKESIDSMNFMYRYFQTPDDLADELRSCLK